MATLELKSTTKIVNCRWVNRAVEVAVIAAILVVIVLLLKAETVGAFDGEFQLKIMPASKSGMHIESLYYATTIDRATADRIAQNSNAVREGLVHRLERQSGEFVVNISYSGRIVNDAVASCNKPHFVVVFATPNDGSTARDVVEIPAGERERIVSVALP
jgi:hypothetical protein